MKTLRVNAIQMSDIMGHEKSTVMFTSGDMFYPGDEIEVRVWSVEQNQPTGCFVKRYVGDIRALAAHVDDFAIYEIDLLAMRPTIPTV